MLRLRDVSIRHKLSLIVIVNSGLVLILACVAFVIYDQIALKNAMVNDLTSTARVVGANASVALLLDDEQDPQTILDGLVADENIIGVGIYDKDGELLASYNRDESSSAHQAKIRGEPSCHFGPDRLDIFRPIRINNDAVGTVYIGADVEDLLAGRRQYMTIAAGIVVLAFAAGILLTKRLQRVVSGPILRLADVAKDVAECKDYSFRAKRQTKDEVGFLVDRFNDMMDQIQ